MEPDLAYIVMPVTCVFITSIKGIPIGSDRQFVHKYISTTDLFASYAARVIKLFQPSATKSRECICEKPSKTISAYLDQMHLGLSVVNQKYWMIAAPYHVLLTFYVTLKALFDFMESVFWEAGYCMTELGNSPNIIINLLNNIIRLR
jgi:hypothetical protein